jgi:hypothetical protein
MAPKEAAVTKATEKIIKVPTSFLPPSFWVFMIIGPASEAGAHSMLSLKFPNNSGDTSRAEQKVRVSRRSKC